MLKLTIKNKLGTTISVVHNRSLGALEREIANTMNGSGHLTVHNKVDRVVLFPSELLRQSLITIEEVE